MPAGSHDRSLRRCAGQGLTAIAVAFCLYLVIGELWIRVGSTGLAIGTALIAAVSAVGIWKGGAWRCWAIAGGVLAVPVLFLFWDVTLNGLIPVWSEYCAGTSVGPTTGTKRTAGWKSRLSEQPEMPSRRPFVMA